MAIPYYDGVQLAHDGYLVPRGSSSPFVNIYPRTIGGVLQESGVVDKGFTLKAYIIPPANATRSDIEVKMNELNEILGARQAKDLVVAGNTYYKATAGRANYDPFVTTKFIRFEIDFVLGDQNAGALTPRQLTLPNLEGFSRGRTMTFRTKMETGTYKTFTFWHNFDNVKNFEIELNVKHSTRFGGHSNIVRRGGFERITCSGWLLGPEVSNRRNVEAYFFNIMNGPLGRVGTLNVGTDQIRRAFLTELNVEDTQQFSLKYTLTFLSSLQC